MSERKINLEKIANSSGVYRSLMDEQQKHATLSLMLEFGKQLLELVAENAECYDEHDGTGQWSIDKQSILDTINQIE